MDTAFINKTEIWYERQDIVHTPEKSLDKYNGTYSYCIDAENHCFYLHISYIEKSLTDGDNDIKVQFEIENVNESYDFYINKNGFISPDDKIKKAFNLEYNFSEDTKQGQEIYLGLEFKNKDNKTVDNTISFSIIVNSTPYDLADNLTLPFYIEKATTGKTTKEKTTKKQSNITKRSNSKSSAEKTTKFKYIPTPKQHSAGNKTVHADKNDNNSDNYADDEQANDFDEDTVEIIAEEENQEMLSTQSKIMIGIAIVSVVIGAAVLVYNGLKNKKDN
ncbi:MAG: hypothetical protein K2K42_05205 [Eubacterium sp.]|nr:hypothetical protein [Eubacterium sp.]